MQNQALFTRPELKGTRVTPSARELPLFHTQSHHHTEQLAGAGPERPQINESEPFLMSAHLV